MDLQTFFMVAISGVIHLIGIGLFVAWMAIGKPMSGPEWKRWWERVHFLPRWQVRRVQRIAPEQSKAEVVSYVN